MIRELIMKELSEKKLDSVRHIQKQFEKIAGLLLNRYALVAGTNKYRLFEIEFYFYSDIHPDPFVHRHPQQLTKGRWYFHKKGAIYMKGIYRGLDLTFGDDALHTYGGILIRGIVNPDNQNEYIYGPAKCVEYFKDKMKIIPGEADDKNATQEDCPQLYFQEMDLPEEQIISGPRVGLPVRPAEHLANMFRYMHYRYIIYPQLPHKGKKSLIAPGLLLKGWKKEEVNRIFGYRIM